MWNLTSFHFEKVLVLVQDWRMVCARYTIGSQIVLDAPDGTPRRRGSCEISLLFVWRQYWCWLGDVGHVESDFIPFGDSVSCRYKMGAWFVLDVP